MKVSKSNHHQNCLISGKVLLFSFGVLLVHQNVFFLSRFSLPVMLRQFWKLYHIEASWGLGGEQKIACTSRGQRRSALLRRYHLKILGASKLTRNSKRRGRNAFGCGRNPRIRYSTCGYRSAVGLSD